MRLPSNEYSTVYKDVCFAVDDLLRGHQDLMKLLGKSIDVNHLELLFELVDEVGGHFHDTEARHGQRRPRRAEVDAARAVVVLHDTCATDRWKLLLAPDELERVGRL